ncbi:MAG TPA: DUF5665 domain-containing protein [Candidatus Saccharibacteria bacterium]|jgi:hypothetical protein|nr:DUF5665 domain-containing protein [Candidatus Saccharibacteria bacterium]HMT55242.1 DUF5665 domain-containing protein [Candidatus Saccharibacteria bacterium]
MARRKSDTFSYDKFGRSIASLADLHANKKELYKTAFIKGIFSGLGGVIGATIIVTLLLAFLSLFKEVPFIHIVTEPIRNSVDTTN